jgi:hypothetical protein
MAVADVAHIDIDFGAYEDVHGIADLPAESYHHRWKWTYGLEEVYLQTPYDCNIIRYPLMTTVRRKFIYSLEGEEGVAFPRTSIPVDATISERHISVPFSQMFPFPHATIPNFPESVKDMIAQLPPSLVKQLVKHVEVLATEDETVQYVDQQQPILLASNGGAIPGRASYGWILQIGTTPIAKGKGPTFGDDPRSF